MLGTAHHNETTEKEMKKRIIALAVILLAALPFFAFFGSCSKLEGSFSGAEYEYLMLNGEKYELCLDHPPMTRGALLGTLPYGDEKAMIFQATPQSGESESVYVYALIFRDGAYYKKIEQNP